MSVVVGRISQLKTLGSRHLHHPPRVDFALVEPLIEATYSPFATPHWAFLNAPQLRRGAPIHELRSRMRLVPKNDPIELDRRLLLLQGRWGARVETIGAASAPNPIRALFLPARKPKPLRVLVTAGVHGNEPAGPAAVMLFLERSLRRIAMLGDVELTVVPVVNPVGYQRGTRVNENFVDVNRELEDEGDNLSESTRAVHALFDKKEFDLVIDLHASAHGKDDRFFAIHVDSADLLGPTMEKFAERHRILDYTTERYKLDQPGIFTSTNRGTLKSFAVEQGTRWAITFESPSKSDYRLQVDGLFDFTNLVITRARDRMNATEAQTPDAST